MKKWIFMATGIFWACQHSPSSGTVLQGSNMSLTETRRVVSGIIGQPRQVSENGRELYSEFADERGLKLDDPTKVDSRWFSKIVILGDRRPYDITVDVIHEEKDDNDSFSVHSVDIEKSKKLAAKIQQGLHQSRETRNIIDDFRAF